MFLMFIYNIKYIICMELCPTMNVLTDHPTLRSAALQSSTSPTRLRLMPTDNTTISCFNFLILQQK